uniref:DAK2 domain-containing protein n=1 Tax=Candidatus Fimivicinus sp. TaxID=3056640 RepID=UPI003FEDC627
MITGSMLRDAVISASHHINNHRGDVDALNVFPVPDGDTGTNMSMTIGAAAREVSRLAEDAGTGEVSGAVASALLRGARGNSGVILSLIFRGISKGLKGCQQADGTALANALQIGVEMAYGAVMKPTEGTILTVVRLASESAKRAANSGADAVTVFNTACDSAAKALATTPDLLPILKKAGVVDAGGQGFVLILEGMRSVFNGNGIIASTSDEATPVTAQHHGEKKEIVANADGEIKFGYCSEFLINKDPHSTMDPVRLRAYLESIGDCVVVVDDDHIIKVHVHSNEPGNVIQEALKYGPLVNIKIDNMRQQHTNAAFDSPQEPPVQQAALPAQEPVKPFGFVAVAAGEGLKELFLELGADQVVSGGQTMNPSTEDILDAVMATPAEHVFVLPNNKNIIMAAEQTIPLADRGVSVLQTRTIPQGITAMLHFDESLSAEENHVIMMKAAEHVGTGLVTFAARDSSIDGESIKKGQILGMENGKITIVEQDLLHVAYRVTKHLYNKRDCSLITIFYGTEATEEQALELKNMLATKYGSNVDISVVNGGQPVYYFIISVE